MSNSSFFERLYDRCSLVALVQVAWVKNQGNDIFVRCLETFKGRSYDEVEIHAPSIWGEYANNWFKKGERSLIFACGQEYITAGPVGRMLLVDIDGDLYLESFTDDVELVMEGVEHVLKEGRKFVKWTTMRSLLAGYQKKRGNP